jgi:hypothetical protein
MPDFDSNQASLSTAAAERTVVRIGLQLQARFAAMIAGATKQLYVIDREIAKLAALRTRHFAWATGCGAVVIACSNGSNVAVDDAVCGPLISELLIEDKFGQESKTFITGEIINVNVRIKNGGDAPTTLSYDCCPAIRLMIFDSHHEPVYDNLPDGAACTMVLRPVSYAPNETKEVWLGWNQARSDDGSQVLPGEYTVNARDRSAECAGYLDWNRNLTIQ